MSITRDISSLPAGQAWLMDSMRFLGYDIASAGLCFGVAHMGSQALLANELDEFDERLWLISKIFSSIFASFNTSDLSKISLSLEKRQELVKQEIAALNLTDKNKDEVFADIMAFFDGVKLYHNSYLYPHLFDPNKPNEKPFTQNPTLTLPLVISSKLQKEGGVHHLNPNNPLTNAYTKEELEIYFKSLRNRIINLGETRPFSLVLGSSNHVVNVSYNTQKKSWYFIDANNLSKRTVSTSKKLASRINSAFSDNDWTILSTDLYVTRDVSKRDVENRLVEWLSKEQTKALHPTNIVNKAKEMDSYDASWLYISASKGDLQAVSALIKAGADLNQAEENGFSSIFVAAKKKHLTVVQALIDAGADVNQADNNGVTPLYAAAQEGHLTIVEALIAAGANLNQANEDGVTPLYIAAQEGHLTIVEALIAAGADLNQATKSGVTPLCMAAQQGHVAVVQKLIQAGADLNQANENDVTPIYIAAQQGHLDVVHALIAASADLNQPIKNGVTPLYIAANNGHANVVEAIVAAGVDVNQANKYGITPLYIAVHNGHAAVVDTLIAVGADANKADNDGETPFYVAAQKGYCSIMQALINAGADLNQANNNGKTPLYLAAQEGNIEVVKELITHSADSTLAYKATPDALLDLAQNSDKEQSMMDLINRTPSSQLIKVTPLDIAIAMGHREIAELLSPPEEMYKTKLLCLLEKIKNYSCSEKEKVNEKKYLKNFENIINRIESVTGAPVSDKNYDEVVAFINKELKGFSEKSQHQTSLWGARGESIVKLRQEVLEIINEKTDNNLSLPSQNIQKIR